MKQKSILGAIIGCKVGDSMGLPYEGIKPKRQKKMYPKIENQHLFFGTGLISDDTEHLLFTAYAIYRSLGNEEVFEKLLAKALKKWFLTLPYGIGYATLKSSVKLLFGVSPKKSGVNSAGNGPAMRSGILGICFGQDIDKLKKLVKISTRISHSDKKAEIGALVIAFSAYLSSIEEVIKPQMFFEKIKILLEEYSDDELINIISNVVTSVENGEKTTDFCERVFNKKGVSGYIYHTVPAVIHCWLTHQNNFKEGILEIIRCGGDTDTTAAILGAIIGANGKIEEIPYNWQTNVIAFPYTVEYIEKISETLFMALNGESVELKEPSNILVLLRNIMVYPVILLYALRRIFPPY